MHGLGQNDSYLIDLSSGLRIDWLPLVSSLGETKYEVYCCRLFTKQSTDIQTDNHRCVFMKDDADKVKRAVDLCSVVICFQ